jgi:hypothetical protein
VPFGAQNLRTSLKLRVLYFIFLLQCYCDLIFFTCQSENVLELPFVKRYTLLRSIQSVNLCSYHNHQLQYCKKSKESREERGTGIYGGGEAKEREGGRGVGARGGEGEDAPRFGGE